MSDTKTATIEVPSLRVDAVHVVATPFTVHLQFGTSLPDGNVIPSIHLSLAPEFARYLSSLLDQAVGIAERGPQSGDTPAEPDAAALPTAD